MKLKKGDKVCVIAGKDKGKTGKILNVDKESNRVIIEGVNLVTKHIKPGRANSQGGIVRRESPIHASNVMYVYNGKPTRIGYSVIREEHNGRFKNVKTRIARSTGDAID